METSLYKAQGREVAMGRLRGHGRIKEQSMRVVSQFGPAAGGPTYFGPLLLIRECVSQITGLVNELYVRIFSIPASPTGFFFFIFTPTPLKIRPKKTRFFSTLTASCSSVYGVG